MNYLLDTHTFIWALSAPKKIPANARNAIENPENEIFVSSVSFWEIAIKVRNNRLAQVGRQVSSPVDAAQAMGFRTSALLPTEASASGHLREDTDFDPFDRMLIWQAISRKMILVSGDPEFSRFVPDGLRLMWK